MTDGQTRVLVLLLILAAMEALLQPAIKTAWQSLIKAAVGGIHA